MSAGRGTLKSLIAQWEQLVSENSALDAQLSTQCLTHRSCGGGLAVWEAQTVAALDRSIASVSVAMNAYRQGSHRFPQDTDQSLEPHHKRLLGSHSRRVWDLIVPTLDKAATTAGWHGNDNTPTDDPSSGFSLLDSSAGNDTPTSSR